ncbi:MAG: type II toxin-antitoxin system PemK/MazF family toxin [Elusimicrobiota bacterium]
MTPGIRRGQIYFVDLNPTKGREQAGRRPVLIVSDDAINRQPLVAAVVVGTDSANVAKDYPVNVRVRAAESGLSKDTVFLCFRIRSLDHRRFQDAKGLSTPAGALSVDKMREVDRALALVLGLPA